MKKRVLIVGIAFVLLFFSIAANNETEMLGDTQDYLAMSQSFLEQKNLEDPSRPFFLPLIFHPPLYSLFLSYFFFVFGFSYLGAKVVSIFFGILTIIAFYFLLKKIDVKNKELILIAYSTSVVFLVQAQRILSDTVFMLFSIIAIYFILEFEKKQKNFELSGALAALFLALSFYARVAGGILMVATALYFLLNKKAKKAVFIAVIFGILALPWIMFFANYQFLQPQTVEQPGSYINWATDTWALTQSGPIEIVLRFFYNLFYFIFEGIPKTIFPVLLPLFFYLRNIDIFPILYIAGGIVILFLGQTLLKEKKSIFVIYIFVYIIIFSIQPALDDLTFVDRYLYALFPFLLIITAKTLHSKFFAKRNLTKPIFLFIILTGAFLAVGYALTLEDRMLNKNYAGMKESFSFVEKNIEQGEKIVFHAPIHLYLNTNFKGTKEPAVSDKIGANYAIIDGWTGFSKNDFEGFEVVFESQNKTSMVLKRKN